MRTLPALIVATSLLSVPALVHAQPTDTQPAQPLPPPPPPTAETPQPPLAQPPPAQPPPPTGAQPPATPEGKEHGCWGDRRHPWLGGLLYGTIGFMPGEFSAL